MATDIKKEEMEDLYCENCSNNQFFILIEKKLLQCPSCKEKLNYSIWYHKCIQCGFQEPTHQTKSEIIYMHQFGHEKEAIIEVFLNIEAKRCVNGHNSYCLNIGELNVHSGETKGYCDPCYNLTDHKKKNHSDFNHKKYCKYCALPEIKKK